MQWEGCRNFKGPRFPHFWSRCLPCLADSCCSLRNQLDPGQEVAFRLIPALLEGCAWDFGLGCVKVSSPGRKRGLGLDPVSSLPAWILSSVFGANDGYGEAVLCAVTVLTRVEWWRRAACIHIIINSDSKCRFRNLTCVHIYANPH